MSKGTELLYRTSRKQAGMTQSDAGQLLHIADGTLSNYENGRAPVPEDIVDKMCQAYNDELLAYWHLSHTNILGRKYLPRLTVINSGGELAFQSILAKQKLNPVVEEIMAIMSDGMVRAGEAEDWNKAVTLLSEITGKLFSILLFTSKVEKEQAPITTGIVIGAHCKV